MNDARAAVAPDVTRDVAVVRLGRRAYADVLALQHDLVERRARGACGDTLLIVEHDPVVTVGRKGGPDDVAGVAPDVPRVFVERGGEATWHGPGQLVGYPILQLGDGERDLHRYLRALEETSIRALADLGVAAGRNPPHTGVWARDRKLVSIGVAVRRWVTYHGFAINVAPDLAAFGGFRPCGLAPSVMGSIATANRRAPTLDEVAAVVVRRFGEVFRRRMHDGTPHAR